MFLQKMSLSRLNRNVTNALSGIKVTFLSQCAFRCEVCLILTLLCGVFLMPVQMIEKIILILPLFLIIICELINTAIETVIDRISKENHLLSKQAKDIGSALVMLSLIFCVFVWIFMLKDILKTGGHFFH